MLQVIFPDLLVLQKDSSPLHPLFYLPALKKCLKHPKVTQTKSWFSDD